MGGHSHETKPSNGYRRNETKKKKAKNQGARRVGEVYIRNKRLVYLGWRSIIDDADARPGLTGRVESRHVHPTIWWSPIGDDIFNILEVRTPTRIVKDSLTHACLGLF